MFGLFDSNDADLRRIERKLDLILKHLGIDPLPPVSAEVRSLAVAGRKIEAIKVHREQTGAGLAEAKEAVEACERAT